MSASTFVNAGGSRAEAARAVVGAGVAVMGHVGLTPQSISVLGGFRPQGRTAEQALRILQDARALQVWFSCHPQVSVSSGGVWPTGVGTAAGDTRLYAG